MERVEHEGLFVELACFANLAELPARFAFDIQEPQWTLNYFNERVLFVVVDGDLAVERCDFNGVTMNAGRRWRDLEIDSFGVVAAQVELFRFNRAAIFAHAEQDFGCAVAAQADERFDIHARAYEYAARHVDAREFCVEWFGGVSDADSEHSDVARAQFAQRVGDVARNVCSAV